MFLVAPDLVLALERADGDGDDPLAEALAAGRPPRPLYLPICRDLAGAGRPPVWWCREQTTDPQDGENRCMVIGGRRRGCGSGGSW